MNLCMRMCYSWRNANKKEAWLSISNDFNFASGRHVFGVVQTSSLVHIRQKVALFSCFLGRLDTSSSRACTGLFPSHKANLFAQYSFRGAVRWSQEEEEGWRLRNHLCHAQGSYSNLIENDLLSKFPLSNLHIDTVYSLWLSHIIKWNALILHFCNKTC